MLVTAFGREEVREEAERLELDGFLLKPVTKSMIVDTLVNVFAAGEDGGQRTVDAGQAEALRGARILVVEDNEINQQIAVELLQGAGATVEIANNGREAVERLSRQTPPPFDVVLMDLQMPEMDGYQATAKLRSDPRLASLPIVAMTAHATVEERQSCLAAGMNDHVAKPIDPAALFETVGKFYKPADAGTPLGLSREGGSSGDLPSVAGLDTSDGLARVGGNEKLYRKLLRDFAAQQGRAAEQIAEALAIGDAALAERLAHTLKGVAGNLGASDLQAAAGKLERCLRERASADDIEIARQQVASVLVPLITALGSAPGPASPEAPEPVVVAVDFEGLRAAVAQLRALLSDSDPGAGDFVDANRDALRPLFEAGRWPEFENLVHGYAFAEAQAQLDRAVETAPGRR